METVIFFAKRKEDALACVQALCEDIKKNEEAAHKLYFSKRFMGAYIICKGEEKNGKRKLTGDKELIILPASRESDFERLKLSKNVISCKNCMFLVGETKNKKDRRAKEIDWLLS